MDGTYAEQIEAKVLGEVSSLKRATGIPDSRKHPDAFDERSPGRIHVYTTDRNSAQILSNLISQCAISASGRKDGKKFVEHEKRYNLRIAEIAHLEKGEYLVTLEFPEAFTMALADQIHEKIQLLVGSKKPSFLR